jgi:hypothetical protein
MKKFSITTLVIMLTMAATFAQTGNVVIFSEGGERFTAIMNGERMNMAPATNIKVADLNQPGYKLKVIFEDTKLGEISKDIMVSMGEEAVYMVKLDKKGGYKVAWRSATPIAQATPGPASQVVYNWGAPAPAPVPVVQPSPAPVTVVQPAPVTVVQPAPLNTGTTVVVQETVTTTNGGVTGTPNGEAVNMNVNVPGFGMNVTINDNMTTTTTGISTTTTTTTTTTTLPTPTPAPVVVVQPAPAPPPCPMMDPTSFENAKRSIKSKSFEDSQFAIAKQITQNNCLSAVQIKGIADLFSFEATKLDYAKFAWGYCIDRNNYYLINDAFSFESTIEELDAYISSQR